MSIPPPIKAAAEAVRTYLKEREAEMFGLLRTAVEINSHTGNKPGVDEVGGVMRQAMKEAGLNVIVEPRKEVGDLLLGRNPATGRHERQVLLIGHLDTVFPPDLGFKSFSEEGDLGRGPGGYDMKGGLVAAIYALKALDYAGLLDGIPITLLMNSDEETGSQYSKSLILAEARKSLFALVFEGRGMNGEVVTGRKGMVKYDLTVRGQAGGHVGSAGPGKASAILEMARLIVDLEGMNDQERRLQVNVGLVKGGTASNAVPQEATATLDVRFPNAAAGQEISSRILNRCEVPATPGTSIEIMAASGRPAMETNEDILRLLEQARLAGDALGQEVLEETRGGVSDANFLAAAGVPVLDGFGPRGGKDHSPAEYMVRSSLASGAAFAALTLWLCWERMRGA